MSPLPPLEVLVVDDERYARTRLHRLLTDREQVGTIDDADSGAVAVEALRRTAYDLVFLDVQMPELTGIEVVERIGPANMPTTIFVTAYDEYAMDAFDLAALDYLLKPFDNERFEQSFERALERNKLEAAEAATDRFQRLLDAPEEGSAPTDAVPTDASSDSSTLGSLKRLTVDLPGKVRVIAVDDIRFITAEDAYVKVHTDEEAYLLRERMHVMDDRLPSSMFVRIHRSTIVRVELIESVLQRSGGDYAVRLHDGKRLKVSRGRHDDLLSHLEEGAV